MLAHHRRVRSVLSVAILCLSAPACVAMQTPAVPSDLALRSLSDAALERLRRCESGGDYRAVSRSGRYRGRTSSMLGRGRRSAGWGTRQLLALRSRISALGCCSSGVGGSRGRIAANSSEISWHNRLTRAATAAILVGVGEMPRRKDQNQ